MIATRAVKIVFFFMLVAVSSSLTLLGADTHVSPDSSTPLQELIDSLEPGSVVIMAPGEYQGPILLQQPISLMSEAPLAPYVQPDMLSFALGNETVWITGGIVVNTSSVHLQGIHTKPDEDGISVGFRIEAGNASLVQCSSRQANLYGLYCAPNAEVSCTSLQIIDSQGVGVFISPLATLNLHGSVVFGCDSTGILCQGTLIAFDSTITLNGFAQEPSDIGHGIQLLDDGTCWLESCLIAGNKGYGIDSPWNGECEGEGLCRSVEGQDNTIPPFGDFINRLGTTSFDQYLALPRGFFNDSWVYETYFSWEYSDEGFSVRMSGKLDLVDVVGDNTYTVFDFPKVEESLSTACVLDDLASQLLTLAQESGFVSDQEIVQFFAAFVRGSMWYDQSRADHDGWGTYTPILTLVNKSGVCRDFSILLVSLLKRSGFQAVGVSLPNLIEDEDGHVVVGVQIDGANGSYVQVGDAEYFLIDPTPGGSQILGEFDLDDWGEPRIVTLNETPNLNYTVYVDWRGVLSYPPTDSSKVIILSVTLTNNGRIPREGMWIQARARWVGEELEFDPDPPRSVATWIPPLVSEESFTVQIGVRIPVGIENVHLYLEALDGDGVVLFGESLGFLELVD